MANPLAKEPPLIRQGTIFPPGRLNRRFFRTDLGLECYYDGARWLTVNEYSQHLVTVAGTGNYSSTVTNAQLYNAPIDQSLGGSWVTRLNFGVYVGTTNNGSNYWTVQAYTADITDASSVNLGSSFNTTAVSANNRNLFSVIVGAAANVSHRMYWLSVTKTSGPGTLSITGVVFYRLIVT